MPRVIVYNNDGTVLSSYDSADAPITNVGTGGSGTGTAGPPGPQGIQGVAGPQGLKGDKGDLGAAGARGADGVAGSPGPKGDTGAASTVAGPAGAKGDTGAQGLKGDTGLQGAASTVPGPKGDTGTNGTNGVDGAPGAAGAPGVKGDTGPQGTSTLTTQSVGLGTASVGISTVSTTATPATQPGTTVAWTWNATFTSAFMGMSYVNNSTTNDVTAALTNVTTGAIIWSGTLTKNFNGSFGQFAIDTYKLDANTKYVFNLTSTASNTANLYIQPLFLFPAASNAANISSLSTAVLQGPFSTGSVAMNVAGTTSGLSFKFPRALSVFNFQATNTSNTALSVRLIRADTAGAVWTQNVAAGASAVNYGPFNAGTYPITTGVQHYFLVTGSGQSGTLILDTLLLSTTP